MSNKPAQISEFSDKVLSIVWDDGHESLYIYEDLRQACPCATCRQERKASKSGRLRFKKTIPLRAKPEGIKPMRVESIGQYALKFHWNDKHDTGIYSFEFLRDICSCEACTGSRES